MELAHGIAHVSFAGGGVFLPARDPYERQMLIEHVAQRVRTKGHVQILVDNHRWMVRVQAPRAGAMCAACGQVAETACFSGEASTAVYCLRCALGVSKRVEVLQHQEWRQVG